MEYYPHIRYFLKILVFSAAYYAGGKLGLLIETGFRGVAPLWPPSGIAMGVFVLLGYRMWPGIVIGVGLLAWDQGVFWATAAITASGNIAEAAAGRYLLNVSGFHPELSQFKDIANLTWYGAIIATLFSAIIGVTGMALSGAVSWDDYGVAWLTWWLSDGAGVLIVMPLLLVWKRLPAFDQVSISQLSEGLALTGLIVIAVWLSFFYIPEDQRHQVDIRFLVIPFTLWAALRFGLRGATLVIVFVAASLLWGSQQQPGMFVMHNALVVLLLEIAFITVTGFTAMALAVIFTERVQASEQARAVAQRFRVLVETMNEGLGVQDENGVATFVNDRLCEIMGYSRQELLSQPVTVFVGEHNTQFWSKLMLARRRGETFQYESDIVRKDGKRVYIRVSPQALYDFTGQFKGSFGVFTDITEQREAQEALSRSENELRLVADNLPVLIAFVGPDYRYRFVNRPYQEMFGTLADEIVGHYIWEVLSKSLYATIKPRVEQALGGEYVTCEVETLTSKHGQRALSITHVPNRIPDSGLDGFFVLITDTTERKQAAKRARKHEAELAHMARLNMMGEMTTNLAHELNQPLAAITNYSSAGLRMIRSGGHETEKIRGLFSQINTQAQRAGDIIRHLRGFLRKDTLPKDAVDLNEVICDAVELISLAAQDIEIKLELDQDLPLVRTDRIQIEQVVLNLIRNSIDAFESVTHDSAVITLRTHDDDKEDNIVITIEDNGPGLDPSSAANIFKPFVTNKAHGMGLGLSISRTIIEAQDGKLWFDSDIKSGAAFHFTLPVYSA